MANATVMFCMSKHIGLLSFYYLSRELNWERSNIYYVGEVMVLVFLYMIYC